MLHRMSSCVTKWKRKTEEKRTEKRKKMKQKKVFTKEKVGIRKLNVQTARITLKNEQ